MISVQGMRYGLRKGYRTATTLFAIVIAVSQPSVAQEICAPRSISEPGRLNLSLEVEDFGLVAPCRAKLQLYIARNSVLRAVEGRLRPVRQSSEDADTSRFSLPLEGPTGGLYRGEVSLPPWDAACADTTVAIEILQCRDAGGAMIRCPEIGLTRSEGFATVTLGGAGSDTCVDR